MISCSHWGLFETDVLEELYRSLREAALHFDSYGAALLRQRIEAELAARLRGCLTHSRVVGFA